MCAQHLRTQTLPCRGRAPTVGKYVILPVSRFAYDYAVLAGVAVPATPVLSRRELGTIGVDVNAHHLAASVIDAFGRLIGTRRIDRAGYARPLTRQRR